MTFVIASIVVILTFAAGALLAWVVNGADKAVVSTRDNIDKTDKSYNPALTLGYKINAQAEAEEQIKEARLISAKQAAALPRGANMKIGWKEDPGANTASDGVNEDPWTASKIAQFHGWDGAKTGVPTGGVPVAQAAPAAAAAAPAASGKIELVAGKDYPVIEITDAMSPEEVRKARIANSKARSAAMKAAKAAGAAAPAAATAATVQAAPAAPSPVAVGIKPPTLIPITDDMSPDDTRKARIANSKARSTFNKALKEAGIDPKTVEIDDQGNIVMPAGASLPTAAPQAAPAAPVGTPQAAGPIDLAAMGITPPQLVEITDDMSPDDVRKARINNSKARSAFNKSLKDAGIDPKSVEIVDSGKIVLPQNAAVQPSPAVPTTPAESAPVSPPPQDDGGAVDLSAIGISPPELVEITDDMSPDEIRQARISNSKARSAFNKALKEAGVDPKSVNI